MAKRTPQPAVDWSEFDDTAVVNAAERGEREAARELKRRNAARRSHNEPLLWEPPPADNSQ